MTTEETFDVDDFPRPYWTDKVEEDDNGIGIWRGLPGMKLGQFHISKLILSVKGQTHLCFQFSLRVLKN